MPTLICVNDTFFGPGCGRVLTADERQYYGTGCEQCVSAGHHRIVAWREGGDDPELDQITSAPSPTKQ